jgi:homoserine dehydrogenase
MMNIAIAGAGTIGSALIRLLASSDAATGIRVKAVLVRDLSKPRPGLPAGTRLTDKPAEIFSDPEIGAVIELMGGTDAAFEIASAALKAGKALVTANKNLLAERGPELFALAEKTRAPILFEAAVCAGMPIVRALRESLRADPIASLEGIVNGTTNYVLTRMTEEGLSYADALAEAKRLGLAEPDPSYDVSGRDAACKLGVLGTLAFGSYLDARDLGVTGIESLEAEDVKQAKAMGYLIKLLAAARRGANGSLDAEVGPVLLPLDHPLAAVRMEYNAVLVESRGLGKNLFMGRGAGPDPTAVSLLTDILDVAEGWARAPGTDDPFLMPKPALASPEEAGSRYYLRLSVPDRAGVLAKISSLFAGLGISIASVLQPESREASDVRSVPLIITTHRASRASMEKLSASLAGDGWGKPVVMRIQED